MEKEPETGYGIWASNVRATKQTRPSRALNLLFVLEVNAIEISVSGLSMCISMCVYACMPVCVCVQGSDTNLCMTR